MTHQPSHTRKEAEQFFIKQGSYSMRKTVPLPYGRGSVSLPHVLLTWR